MGKGFLKFTYVTVAAAICGAAPAVTPENAEARFQDIQKRNLFRLKSPEPEVREQPPKQLPKIILTGITTVLGNKRALLKELPLGPDGKTPDASKELLMMLTEGQREGDVEVLEIDEKKGAVKVNNSGTVVTLTFDKDGPKPPVSAPPGTPGITPGAGVPASTGVMQAGNPGFRFPLPPGYTNANIHPLPTRTPRTQTPGTASASPSTSVLSPTGPITSPPGSPPLPTAAQQAQLTPEEQQVLLEAQRQAMQYPTSSLPNAGSGTFATPTPQGIQPAFAPPPPGALPGRALPIVPQ